MTTFGYCRVSTEEQVLGCTVQRDMILDTVLPAIVDRIDWTAEDWLHWFAKQNGDGQGNPLADPMPER